MQKILIIEDEADLREALQTTFVSEGYDVRTAPTSEEGLKFVSNTKPDLILVDVFTHSLHAETFLQRLRQLPEGQNDSKVIVLTNLDNDITRNKVEKYGIDAFLIKAETPLARIAEKVKEVLST